MLELIFNTFCSHHCSLPECATMLLFEMPFAALLNQKGEKDVYYVYSKNQVLFYGGNHDIET